MYPRVKNLSNSISSVDFSSDFKTINVHHHAIIMLYLTLTSVVKIKVEGRGCE